MKLKSIATLTAIGLLTMSCGRKSDISDVATDLAKTNERLDQLEERLDQAYQNLAALERGIDDLNYNQDDLEQSVTLLTSRVVDLELALEGQGMTITKVIDPCGDTPNKFDEVLFQLSNGDIIAYFQHGNKRHLSKLPNGDYVTTDHQACRFSVVDGEIED